VTDIDGEIASNLDLPPIPRKAWWQENESRFPVIANVARHYLGMPCTSVASEQLLSSENVSLSQLFSSSAASGGAPSAEHSRLHELTPF